MSSPNGNSADRPRFVDVFGDLVVTPHFHPIVDLYSGTYIGHEILSRGSEPFKSPADMFGKAEQTGLWWELEMFCQRAAITRISSLPEELRCLKYFFLNVSPRVFTDPRFAKNFIFSELRSFGVEPENIVMEITEENAVDDHAGLKERIAHFVRNNYKFALDDFGAGYSSLMALVATAPHFLKLDKFIVRGIHKDAYKQQLVRSLVSLSTSIDSKLIAEGVETWDELELLFRLGIRYVQGFLFSKPMPQPAPEPDAESRRELFRIVGKYNYPKIDMEERIGNMVLHPRTIEKGSMTCEQLNKTFHQDPALDHVVVLDMGVPVGLVTRQHFYFKTGGPFGFALYQRRDAWALAKENPLTVHASQRATELSRLAMDRFTEDQYDPVIVVDEQGRFIGTITMKQIIDRSVQIEVMNAMGANPLTNLPGNRTIEKWIREEIHCEHCSVVYADLDQFKAYNDSYGFLMGDEMIRLTAKVLATHAEHLSPRVRLGHVGGDDFIMVCDGEVNTDVLQAMCNHFDEARYEAFAPEDVSRGHYHIIDRDGQKTDVPIVTISLAVVHNNRQHTQLHPLKFAQVAAKLKKQTKAISQRTGCSSYLVGDYHSAEPVDLVLPDLPRKAG